VNTVNEDGDEQILVTFKVLYLRRLKLYKWGKNIM